MKRFLKKALRYTAILCAVLAVLLLIFYAEEDWRGARDWSACQRDLAAKGETLDLRQLIPPGNPADDLSKIPIFAEDYQQWRDYQETGSSKTDPRLKRLRADMGGDASAPSLNCYYPDKWDVNLSEWQKYYRGKWSKAQLPTKVGTPAEDVLQALSPFDPEIAEIDNAISNPKAYWPNDNYAGARVKMLEVAKVLRLKAAAQLEENHPDQAEQSFLFSVRIGTVLKNSFMFLSSRLIVSEAILWQGLHSHLWNSSQLREMEESLAASDILSSSIQTFRMERASSLETIDKWQRSYVEIQNAFRHTENPVTYIVLSTNWFRPAGWWNQDRSAYSREIQSRLEAIDVSQGILSSSAFPAHPSYEYWELPPDVSTWKLIYTPLAAGCTHGLDMDGQLIAKAETYRRLARLACRLEEYRIAHGQYPHALSDLPDLPPHLNQEVLSTQPLQYKRTGDTYTLYSLGWDQKDDGGKLATDPRQGDWPWPSP